MSVTLRFFALAVFCVCAINVAKPSRYKGHVIGYYSEPERSRRDSSANSLYGIYEHVDHYPEKALKKLLGNQKSLLSYFGNPVLEIVNKSVSVVSRFQEQTSDRLCRTKDIRIVPRYAEDISKTMRYIANTEDYSQVIIVQVCDEKPDSKCDSLHLGGYEPKCEQKYQYLKLLSFEPPNKFLQYRQFRIPSTCVCVYTSK